MSLALWIDGRLLGGGCVALLRRGAPDYPEEGDVDQSYPIREGQL